MSLDFFSALKTYLNAVLAEEIRDPTDATRPLKTTQPCNSEKSIGQKSYPKRKRVWKMVAADARRFKGQIHLVWQARKQLTEREPRGKRNDRPLRRSESTA